MHKIQFLVTGNSPSPRAAHAAVSVDTNQLVIYGGATGGSIIILINFFFNHFRWKFSFR